jgi:hypothetical protein
MTSLFAFTGRSAESKRKRFYPLIEKLDLELPVNDGLGLPDELVQPLFGNRAISLIIHVKSVSGAWRISVNQNSKPDTLGSCESSWLVLFTRSLVLTRFTAVGVIWAGDMTQSSARGLRNSWEPFGAQDGEKQFVPSLGSELQAWPRQA